MLKTVLTIAVLLILLAGSVCLQIFLSKTKNKGLGLIIPLICFLFSLFIVFSLTMFTGNIQTTSTTISSDGTIVTHKAAVLPAERPSTISMVASALPVFLMSNIPTLLFLAIYFACREKWKLRKELDKMNVQDLE